MRFAVIIAQPSTLLAASLLVSACAASPTMTPAATAPPTPAPTPEAAGITLAALSGRVEVFDAATGAWRLSAPTESLEVGTLIRTYAVSTARLDLPDGSRILLKPATELALTVFNFDGAQPDAPITQLRVDVLRGQAAFDIVRFIGPDSAFVVFMPTAVFAARGDEQAKAALAPRVRLMPAPGPRAGFSTSTVNLIAGERQVNLLLGSGHLAGLALNPASGQLVPYRFELDGDPDRPYGLVVDLLNPPVSENGQTTFDSLATRAKLDETMPELLTGLEKQDTFDEVDLNLPSGGGESGTDGFFQTVTLSDDLLQQIMARLGYVALGGALDGNGTDSSESQATPVAPAGSPPTGEAALLAALLPGIEDIRASGDDAAGLADWLVLDDAALQKQLTDSGGVLGVAMDADGDFIISPRDLTDDPTGEFIVIAPGDRLYDDPTGDFVVSPRDLTDDPTGDFIITGPSRALTDDPAGDFIVSPRDLTDDPTGDFILATLGVHVATGTRRPIAPLARQAPTREAMVNVFLAAFEGPHPEPLFDADGSLIGLQPPPQVVFDQNGMPIGLLPVTPLPAPEKLRRAADPRSQYVEWVSQAAKWLFENQELALEQQSRQAIELLADDVRHAGYYGYSASGSDQADTRQADIAIAQVLTWGLDIAYEDRTGLRYQPIYSPVSLDPESGALRPTVIQFGEDGRFAGFAAFDPDTMRVGESEGPLAPRLPGMVFDEAGELTWATTLNFFTRDAGGNTREWVMASPFMFDERGRIAGYQPAPFVILGADGQPLGLTQPEAVFLINAEMAEKPVVIFDENGSPRTPEQFRAGEVMRDEATGELTGVLYWGHAWVWDSAFFTYHKALTVEAFSVALPDESGSASLVTMVAQPLVDERGALAGWYPPPVVVLNAEGWPAALATSFTNEGSAIGSLPIRVTAESLGPDEQRNFSFDAVYVPGQGVLAPENTPLEYYSPPVLFGPGGEEYIVPPSSGQHPAGYTPPEGATLLTTKPSDQSGGEGSQGDQPPPGCAGDESDAGKPECSKGDQPPDGGEGDKSGEGEGPPPGCAGDDSDRFRPGCSKGDQQP